MYVFPKQPWKDGLTKKQAEYLIKNNHEIINVFPWAVSPEGVKFWGNYYKGVDLEKGAKIIASWIKEERKPVAVLNRKGVLLKAYYPEDRYGDDWEMIYEGDEIRMKF